MRNDRLAFQSWCSRATAHIRFKADRPAVEQELLEHMEDHFNALLQEGLTLQEAERQTLCAMGDADETGAALAKVHKPYLGWLYLAAKWLVALSAVFQVMGSPNPFKGSPRNLTKLTAAKSPIFTPTARTNATVIRSLSRL